MTWDEFVNAAEEIGWPAYLGTADARGRPHVAAVAPGFSSEGVIWFATRAGSGKHRNLMENPAVAFHWAMAGSGPGELFARGEARLHDSAEARERLWVEANLPYDPSSFFGSPDNPGVVFVETAVTSASLLGPDFRRRFWRPETSSGS